MNDIVQAEESLVPSAGEIAERVPEGATPEGGLTPPYWPADWREATAAAIAGDDEKARAREIKRLERYADPARIYAKARELEAKLSQTGAVRRPGPKATVDEIKAYHRSIGVPETPADYFSGLRLDNGAVLGSADRPLAESFAAALHPAGATPEVVNAALNWYFRHEEAQAATLDEADEAFRVESERALRDELGAGFARKTNAIAALFADAPGGTDLDDPGSLFARLMGGRLADGRIVGNDPDMVRFLAGLAGEVRPFATVTEAGNSSGQSIDSEIAEIRTKMRNDRRGYFADSALQARYRELIAMRERYRGS
jgi:hypothetical protein